MRLVDWFDRNMWAVPALTFVLTETTLIAWRVGSGSPILLSSAQPAIRQQIYTSLASTASSLLGFAIASVAILAAFSPRAERTQMRTQPDERQLARARAYVTVSLLATALFLLILLVTTTVALGLTPTANGKFAIVSTAISSALASLTGLLTGGLGLSLSIIERTRT